MNEKTKGFLTEFKEFAMKGNVIDLAIGVVIGGAFNKIVSSLVEHIIMPIIGAIIGGTDFKNLQIVLSNNANTDKQAILKYGEFIQNVFDFLIIAFSMFIAIKIISKFNFKKNQEKEAQEKEAQEKEIEEVKEPELTKEEILLTEIRDLLKNK